MWEGRGEDAGYRMHDASGDKSKSEAPLINR
jgi:hypothetical protein